MERLTAPIINKETGETVGYRLKNTEIDRIVAYRKLGELEDMEEQGKLFGKWIPCSERLPKKRDWYLAIFKEPGTGFIGLPYIADYLMGNHTAYTTNDGWIIKDCTDICDRESLYHKNLECVAWMPLPEPYKGEE